MVRDKVKENTRERERRHGRLVYGREGGREGGEGGSVGSVNTASPACGTDTHLDSKPLVVGLGLW